MGGMMGYGVIGPGMMGLGYAGQGGIPAGNGWLWGLGMGLGGLMMLAFWGAVIIGVVLLVRWATGRGATADGGDEPLTILRRRYAAGEIDKETYERMRSEFGDSTSDVHQQVRANGRTQVPR
jgi:putative membrane protein